MRGSLSKVEGAFSHAKELAMQEAGGGKGTLKSHQINSFTIRDSTWGETFAQRQMHPGVSNTHLLNKVQHESEPGVHGCVVIL